MLNRAGVCPRCFVKLQEEAARKRKQKLRAPKGGLIYGFAFEEDQPEVKDGYQVPFVHVTGLDGAPKGDENDDDV